MSSNSPPSPSPSGTFYTVVSNDSQNFKFSELAIKKCETLSTLIENLGSSDKPIPVGNVDGKTLDLVHKWCEHHKNDTEPVDKEENGVKIVKMSKFDAKLLEIDDGSLRDLIHAANYLNAQELISVACKKVLGYVTDKTQEEIRAKLAIKTDEEDAAAGFIVPPKPKKVEGDSKAVKTD